MNLVNIIAMTALALAATYVAACACSPYTTCDNCTGKYVPTSPANCVTCSGAGMCPRVGTRFGVWVFQRAAGRVRALRRRAVSR